MRTPLVAAGAVALALGVAACGSDDADDTTPATTTTAAAAATTSTNASTTAASAAGAPDAATLDATLTKFFDPAVPTAEKVLLIEDGQKQATAIDQFNGVLQGYPLTADVTAVTPVDPDTVTATTTIAGPHGGAPVPVTFDEEDGAWVVSTESVCSILGMGQLACVQ
ncbi:nuclear transport factor 2 family protein [Rhodococcus sp. NPDC003318]|uniref:nuclear transport factor 2 family protein n=1 Tax=Rhodococcus sp. NPDC003318 TaxID=3364503 RepID=UPI003684D3EF